MIILASIAATNALSYFVSSLIARATKNYQVLQIFPLKRYGIAWTAGVTGSRGLVVGSPTYNDQGAVEEIVAKLFSTNEEYDKGGLYIARLIAELINSDELKNIANKYDVQQNIITEDGEPTLSANNHKNSLRAMLGKSSLSPSGIYGMVLTPRADYNSSNDVAQSYNHFAMLDVEQCQNDPKLQNNLFISSDNRIRTFVENGFFKLVHETPGLNKGSQVDTLMMTINGNKHYLKAIKYKDKKGNDIIDVPMLNKDALNVLYEILRRTKNKMPSSKSSDRYEAYDLNKSSFVALESALRIGDKETMAAAGFTFILHGVDQAAIPLYTAVKEIHDEIENFSSENNSLVDESLFDSKDLGENKIAITVRMPKITQEYNDNEKSTDETSSDSQEETSDDDSEETSENDSEVDSDDDSDDDSEVD